MALVDGNLYSADLAIWKQEPVDIHTGACVEAPTADAENA
jgi:hypothetical protein